MTTTNTYLRRLYETEVMRVGATDGTETLYGASEVFTGYRDSDLQGWGLDVPSPPTPETFAVVLEQAADGTFTDILGPPDKLKVWQQSQIKKFVVDYPAKLRTQGFATFFPFTKEGEEPKKDGSNVFVADVYVIAGGLEVGVYEFRRGSVWGARCQDRFVLPQLEA